MVDYSMKQKQKNIFVFFGIVLGCSVFLFAGSLVFLRPVSVFAQTCTQANVTGVCKVGQICPNGQCQDANQCTSDNNCTNAICMHGSCIADSSAGGTQNPTQYTVPSKDGTPTNTGSCGTSDSNVVKQIQGIVGATQDGVCGPNTIADIQIWQSQHNLTDDGIVGTNTASTMGVSLTGTGNSTNNPTTSSATCPAGTSQGTCPTGLCMINSLCQPPSQFTSGIAGASNLTDLLKLIIQILLTLAGVIAVVVLIIGGFWYITSAGNEEQSEKGRKAIVNAIIGLIVVILSYALVNILSGFLVNGK